ARRTTI
ncbi:hypothetical protein LDE32_18045, partial [Mycobacterium tuberculosis]